MKWTEKVDIKFDFDGNKNYFIAQVDEKVGVVDYEVNMIENNPSIGSLNLIVCQFDDKIELMYDITGRTPLTDIIKRRNLSKEEFVNLIRNILRNLTQFDELMLENGITILNPDYIYVDESDFKATVIYIPVVPDERIKVKNELVAFFNRIYSSNVNLMGDGYTPVINKLIEGIRSEGLEIPKLYKEIEYMSNNSSGNLSKPVSTSTVTPENNNVSPTPNFEGSKEEIVDKITGEQIEIPEERVNYSEKSSSKFNKKLFFIIVFQILVVILATSTYFMAGLEENTSLIIIVGILLLDMIICLITLMFGSKHTVEKLANIKEKNKKTGYMKTQKQEVETGAYETIILGADENDNSARKAYIAEKSKGIMDRHLINKDRFRIGRLVGEVDLVVKNGAVGKVHCEIVKNRDKYYVVDCNSKNGTFLNGGRISAGSNYEIKNNDSLRFANSEYIFIIE